jgi:hypothetical protein
LLIKKTGASKDPQENIPRKLNSNYLIVVSVTLAVGTVLAAVNSISIPKIEFGRGVADLPSCLDSAIVGFSASSTSDDATISEVEVGPVGSECRSKHLRVTLEGSSQSVIRRITWQLPSSGGPFTQTADSSQIGSPAINPEDVLGIILDISDTAFSD